MAALVAVCSAALVLVALAMRRLRVVIAVVIAFGALSSFVVVDSVLVRPSLWSVIYAAALESPHGDEASRRRDLAQTWVMFPDGDMRVRDWYVLAGRWGVCHGLWPQDECFRVRPHPEAVGIFREMLSDLARGG